MSENDDTPKDEWDACGGPAFPTNDDTFRWPGMSLRDWFAGQALASAMCAAAEVAKLGGPRLPTGDIADIAYEFADAMLKAREKSE